MRRYAGASSFAVVVQPVVPADDFVSFDVAHAEGNAAVETDILGGYEAAIAYAIDDHAFIQQACGVGLVGYLMGEGDRIPKRGKGLPVGFREGTCAGKDA